MPRDVVGGTLGSMPLRDHAFLYIDCDIPQGQTVASWRADRSPAAGSRGWLSRVLGRRRHRGVSVS